MNKKEILFSKYFDQNGCLKEQDAGFSKLELDTTLKVLNEITTRRFLLTTPMFEELLDLVQLLGQQRLEKKKQKQNQNKIKSNQRKIELNMGKIKLKEKNYIIKQIQENLPIMQSIENQLNNEICTTKGIKYIPFIEQEISSRVCSICKIRHKDEHHFYNRLCIQCGDLNYEKRHQKCDLTGRIALVTGGRIKIGYQIALILLRNNCYTIVTTRFPKEAAFRFSQEPDFQEWKHLLKIYGLDFKFINFVSEFCEFMKRKYNKLDIIINNAAQTIRKPPVYFQNCIEFEQTNQFNNLEPDIKNLLDTEFECKALSNKIQDVIKFNEITDNKQSINDQVEKLPLQQNQKISFDKISQSSLITTVKLIDEDYISQVPQIFDINNQIVDFRPKNTWILKQEEVTFTEYLEVQMINAASPFMINAQLKELLEKSEFKERFIINVSAVEGIFSRSFKSSNHPHTNMAKASLNMMTRTSGSHYADSNIFMNAVDTGWVTDENPLSFQTPKTVPLDEIDGAMRVLDPIFIGINQKIFHHSLLFKDYKKCDW